MNANNWSFERLFGEDGLCGAGQLVLPLESEKPSKNSKDNAYVLNTLFTLYSIH